MTAFTSKANGNWSASGQTTWNEVGVPGDGDTVTITHDVAVDVNTTVGAGGATGTVALTLGTNGDLACDEDVAFPVKGNILHSGTSSVTMAPGSRITLTPPSGQQYVIDLKLASNLNAKWLLNGTAAKHCTLSVDKSAGGLLGYMDQSGLTFRDGGIVTADYADFLDFGDATHRGILSRMGDGGQDTDITITNCTFTRCNLAVLGGAGNPWDGNFTMSNVTFTDSEGFVDGLGTQCLVVNLNNSATTGVRSMTNCSYDLAAVLITARDLVATENYFHNRVHPRATAGQTIQGNFIRATTSDDLVKFYDDVSDNVMVHDHNEGNPHWSSIAAANVTVDGFIFWYTGSQVADFGDGVFPGESGGMVQNCIMLPSFGDNKVAGFLVSLGGGVGDSCSVNHNTCAGRVAYYGETYAGHADIIPSFKSNLAWKPPGETITYLADRHGVGGVQDGFTATGASHNWGWALTAGNNGRGYQALSAGDMWAAGDAAAAGVDGENPIDSDPDFVDATRNPATWGSSEAGTDGSVAAVLAVLQADTTRISELMDWIKAGFAPQNADMETAGHDGATPGAVAFVAAASGGGGLLGGLSGLSGISGMSG